MRLVLVVVGLVVVLGLILETSTGDKQRPSLIDQKNIVEDALLNLKVESMCPTRFVNRNCTCKCCPPDERKSNLTFNTIIIFVVLRKQATV